MRLQDRADGKSGAPRWSDRGVRADFPDFGLNGFQVLKGLGTFPLVPQEGGGVVDGGHLDAAALEPLTVLRGDFEVLFDDDLGGDAAKADDDLGPQQRRLPPQPADANKKLFTSL